MSGSNANVKDQQTQAANDASSSVVERKLVTILSADVAEYSRLMAEDEEATLRVFREHSQTFRALVDMHNGRIFNTAGDALLAEFTSPIEAVRCATDIQAALRTRNDQLPRDRQVRFRIGVNLGDVMMQGSDLLGDGVNVASRLQSAAEPGGIIISGSIYDQIRNKLSLNIEALGERRFKNIPQPVRTFTIAGSEEDGLQLPTKKKSSFAPGQWVKTASASLPSVSMPRKLPIIPIAAVLGVVVIGAGGYWAYTKLPKSTAHKPIAAQTTTSQATASAKTAVVASGPQSPNVTVLDNETSALLQSAQSHHRTQDEIDSLTDANTQMAAQAAQLRKLGASPADRVKVRALFDKMNKLALDTSHNEATALEHSAAPLLRDLQRAGLTAPDAKAAIAKAEQAKADLDKALAAVQQAPSGDAALKATTQTFVAYDAFTQANDEVAPFYVSARRNDFAALLATARSVSDRVVSLGSVKEPWFLASRARKDAYQTLRNNATQAQTEVAQLDDFQRKADAANSIKKINAAMKGVSAIKARLDSLLENSNAASSTFNQ